MVSGNSNTNGQQNEANTLFIDVDTHRDEDLRFSMLKDDDLDANQQTFFEEEREDVEGSRIRARSWGQTGSSSHSDYHGGRRDGRRLSVRAGRSLSQSMLNVSDTFKQNISQMGPTSSSTLLTLHDNNISKINSEPNDEGTCFQVVLRLRPTGSSQYLDSTRSNIVEVADDLKTITIGKDLNNMHKSTRYPSDQLTFDRIFDEFFSQGKFFQKCIVPMMGAFFRGVNCTVYGYGQSRAGKSYTLFGEGNTLEHEKRGAVLRVVQEIFRYIQRYSSTTPFATKYVVKASFVQIYNECISDLLNFGHHNLKSAENARDSNNPGVVAGVKWEELKSASDICGLLKRGKSNRSVPPGQSKPPDLHLRSHTVLSLVFEQHKVVQSKSAESKGQSVTADRSQKASSAGASIFGARYAKPGTYAIKATKSKFNFVEFAGAEKSRDITAHASGSDNRTSSDDGSKIARTFNTMLTVVSNFNRKGSHIPYRDAKLCYVLKDSLNDESLNLFVAHLFPLPENYAECLSTVKYASHLRQNASLLSATMVESSRSGIMDQDSSYLRQISQSNTSERALDFNASRLKKVAFSTMDKVDENEVETRRQLQQLREEFHHTSEEKVLVERQFQNMKTELDNTVSERDELKKHILDQVSDYDRNTEEVERLRRELHDIRAASYTKQEEQETMLKNLLSKETEQMRDREEAELLKNEIIYIKNELVDAREVKEASQRESDELRLLLRDEREKRKSFEIGTSHWKEEFHRVEEERKLLQRDLIEIGRKLGNANDENVELKKHLSYAKNDIDQLLRAREKLEFELQAASDKIQQVMRENDVLNRGLIRTSIREDELSGAAINVKQIQTELELAKSNSAQLQEELQQVRRNNSKQDSGKIAQLEHKISQLTKELERSKQDALVSSTISAATATAWEKSDNHKSPRDDIHRELETANARITILTEEKDTLRSNLTEALKEVTRLTDEKDRMAIGMQNTENPSNADYRLQQVMTEKMRISRELSEKREQIQCHYEENQVLKMDMANLRLALQKMKSKGSKYEEQISRLQSTLHSCEEEMEQVQTKERSKEELILKIAESQTEVETLKREQADLEKMTAEKQELEARLESTQQDLNSCRADSKLVEHSYDTLRERQSIYETERRKLQDELSEATQQVVVLSNEKERLSSMLCDVTREILSTQGALLNQRSSNDSPVSAPDLSPEKSTRKEQRLSRDSPGRRSFGQTAEADSFFSNISTVSHSNSSAMPDSDGIISNIDLISSNTKNVNMLIQRINTELSRERENRSELERRLENKISLVKELEEDCETSKRTISKFRNDITEEHKEQERLKRIVLEKETKLKKRGFEVETAQFEISQAHEEISRNENVIRVMRDDIAKLKDTIRSSYEEQETLKASLHMTEQELKDVKKEHNASQQELDLISTKHNDLNDQIAVMKSMLEGKEEKCKTLIHQITLAENEIHEKESHILEKENGVQSSLADVYRLKKELEAAYNALREMTNRAEQHEENNKSMLLQNANLKLELHKAREEAETMKKKRDIKMDELQSMRERTDADREAMNTENETMSQNLDDARAEVVILKERVQEMKSECHNKDREANQYKTQNSLLEQDLQVSVREHEASLQQLRRQESQTEHLNDEVHGLKAERDKEQQSLQQLRAQQEEKGIELKELLGKNRTIEQEKNRVKIERDHFFEQMKKTKQELTSSKEHLDRLHREHLTLEGDHHQLTIERDELCTGLLEFKESRNQYVQDWDDVQTNLRVSESTVQQKNKELSSLDREIRGLNSEIGKKNTQLAECEKRCRKLQTELQDKNREHRTLKKDLHSVVEEKNRLLVQLDDKEHELKRVRETSLRTSRDLKSIVSSFGDN